jgi:enterochelin esterase family protein
VYIRFVPGLVEIARHPSRLLAGNPLGDPSVREAGVYLPASYQANRTRRYPTIYFLHGFTGAGPSTLMQRSPWLPSLDQRINQVIERGEMQEAIVVFPDCFTRYGGSQYVDSPAIGRYQSYFTDELVPFIDARYRTLPERGGRALVGKSSGGYGSLVIGMRRPDLWNAIGSHAGDSAFDLCYARELPSVVLALQRAGGIAKFLAWFEAQPIKPGFTIDVMSNLCCAAAWSPRARGPYGFGKGFDLPIDLETGAFIPELWDRWLAADPVRMLDDKRHLDALRSMHTVFLDAGKSDEYMLQLGARQLAHKLRSAKANVVHEEFDGGHMNTAFRYERSFALLSRALGATSPSPRPRRGSRASAPGRAPRSRRGRASARTGTAS